MARTKTYRRRTKSGKLSKPFSRQIKGGGVKARRSTLTGGRRRKQRVRRLKKRGGQLRAGQKFNARGQIVKDRNRTRVANRKVKQGNRRRRRSGRRPRRAATSGMRRR